MAQQPTAGLQIIEKFGPHRAYSHGVRLDTGVEPDRLVKTHCCFCGQQCGIHLKVKDNTVIGFEPRTEFPFNRGMLCPKGVKRYLQCAHPDRLEQAYARDPSAEGGFRSIGYDEAVAKVAAEIQRVQTTHGAAAMGVISGASLTTEKTYLMGKFARMCLKTPNIDYNGRLCMVSAAGGNKKAFGVDRAANPWSDIPLAEVVCIAGANVAECAPITTEYVWQAREHGAKIIVIDPRITPIARTCDLFLPVKPGRDAALFMGILHLMIENECDTHKGHSMIHLEYVDRSESPQTAPVVCMHCDSPTCAEVCPADAIKRTEDGVVQTARKPRCIACNNCVLACPFGVPKMNTGYELMMKCDMCYDRTSIGKKPMCATVCPSQALFFGTRAEIDQLRPRSTPVHEFRFGQQVITTKVAMMVPRAAGPKHVDVTQAMDRPSAQANRQLPVIDADDVMLAAMHSPAHAE